MKHEQFPKKPPKRSQEEATWIAIRAGFVAQGTSVAGWAKANGLNKQNIRMAAFREREGPMAKALLKRTADAAGVKLTQEQITPKRNYRHGLNSGKK